MTGPRVFISYCHEDTDVQNFLLSRFQLAGFSVLTDVRLQPGTPLWHQEVERLIESADLVIVVLSPAAKSSEWVARECSYAKSQERPVIPVLARGSERDAIPMYLQGAQYVNLAQDHLGAVARLTTAIASGVGAASTATSSAANPVRPPLMVTSTLFTCTKKIPYTWQWQARINASADEVLGASFYTLNQMGAKDVRQVAPYNIASTLKRFVGTDVPLNVGVSPLAPAMASVGALSYTTNLVVGHDRVKEVVQEFATRMVQVAHEANQRAGHAG